MRRLGRDLYVEDPPLHLRSDGPHECRALGYPALLTVQLRCQTT